MNERFSGTRRNDLWRRTSVTEREREKNHMNHEGGNNVVVATPCVYVNGKRHALRDGIGETTLLEFLRGLFRVSRARLIFYVFFRFVFVVKRRAFLSRIIHIRE